MEWGRGVEYPPAPLSPEGAAEAAPKGLVCHLVCSMRVGINLIAFQHPCTRRTLP
jgi:hypothetical protein